MVTEEEKRGIAAILYLQSLVGIIESEERALKRWRNFKQWEKERTMAAFTIFGPQSED